MAKKGDWWLEGRWSDRWLSREMGGVVWIWVAKKGDRWLRRDTGG